jgi:hypothetical protein
VGRVQEREEVAHGQRLDPIVPEARDLGPHLRLVQRSQDHTARVEPLADADPAAARGEERRRLRVHVEVVHPRALLAAEFQDVLEARRHEDTGDGARLLEDGVGGDGGPVDEAGDIPGLHAGQREHAPDRVGDAPEEILRRGRHLGQVESAVVAERHDVRESAPDVHSDLHARASPHAARHEDPRTPPL